VAGEVDNIPGTNSSQALREDGIILVFIIMKEYLLLALNFKNR
jgi:hypothetical protein